MKKNSIRVAAGAGSAGTDTQAGRIGSCSDRCLVRARSQLLVYLLLSCFLVIVGCETVGNVQRKLVKTQKALDEKLAKPVRVWLNKAATHREVRRYKALQAEGRLEEALAVAEQFYERRGKGVWGRTYDHSSGMESLGDLYAQMERYEQAMSSYESSAEIRRNISAPAAAALMARGFSVDESLARCLQKQVNLYWEMGRPDEAKGVEKELLDLGCSYVTRPRHLFNTFQEPMEKKRYKELRDREQYAEAIPYAKRYAASREEKHGEDSASHAQALYELGHLHSLVGDYEEAQDVYSRALEINKARGDVLGLILVTQDMSYLYRRSGDYGEAERMLLEALELCDSSLTPEHPNRMRNLEGLAGLYSAMGDLDKAQTLYDEVAGVRRKSLRAKPVSYASTLSNLATICMANKRYDKAETLFLEVMNVMSKVYGKKHHAYAVGMVDLARLYSKTGRLDDAEALLKGALAINQDVLGELSSSHMIVQGDLAGLYEKSGRVEEAETLRKQALEFWLEEFGENHPDTAKSLARYASLLLTTGRERESISYFEKALDAFEMIRGTISTEAYRTSYQRTTQAVYTKAAVAYFRTGDQQRAFEVLERGRAKALLDLLGTRASRRGSQIDIRDMERIEQELNRLRSEQTLQVDAPDREGSRGLLDTTVSRKDLERKRLELLDEKTRLNPELGNLLSVTPATLKEVQSLLDDDVILVEYFHPGEIALQDEQLDELWIFLVTSSSFEVIRVPVLHEQILSTVRKYLSSIQSKQSQTETVDALSRTLQDWLLEPIRDRLRGYPIVALVPWNTLYYVPFAALVPETDSHGASKMRFVINSSASAYRYIKPKRSDGRESIFALGNPVNDLPPLPGAEEEANFIAGLFPQNNAFIGVEATETLVKHYSKGTDVLHFACHGVMDEMLPQFSYLALAPDEMNDGRLEMHEVFNLQWRGVSLVTLSACSSGTGALGAGDDLLGLVRGFIFAGAPSVLCTLWKVDDESTRVFMEEFYRQYTVGKSKTESFQLAQTKLRNDPKWSHPYYWAPFVLWGDWE